MKVKQYNHRLTSNLEDSKLDVMHLIIKNNPVQLDSTVLKNKIEEMSRNNSIHHSASKTFKLFFRYNVLYGTKSPNLIKTYSPKLRPQSASVSQYIKKIHLNGKEVCVFNDDQIQLLFEAKCRDLNVRAKPELEKRFSEFVKTKCINRRIDLSECNIGYNCVDVLKHLIKADNCAGLILQHNSIGDKGIEQLISAIQNNNSLVFLDLSSNDIYYRGGVVLLECLINHPSIISLSLSSLEGVNRNRLTADGVKPLEKLLKKNKYLEILKLAGNSIKNEGLRAILLGLENNTTLKELDISKNEIDEKGLECLPNILTLTKLTDLNLSNNPIKNEGLIPLASSLISPAMNYIRNINLAECKLTIEGIRQFFQVISQNTTLQKINFSNNCFSRPGIKSLETSLSTMNIRELSLSNCSLGKQAVDIAELLLTITTIKSIDLSNNQIDDKTFLHFALLPVKNTSVEEMDFSKNHLTNISGKVFFPNLQNSISLKKVNFYDNQFENSLANLILTCLRLNRNIVYLNVNSNQIQLKIMKEIHTQVNNNIRLSKKKFVPYLKAVIKALDFNTSEFDAVKERIKLAQRDQENLIEKIEDDSDRFTQMKQEEEKRLTKKERARKGQEEELNRLNNELKKVNRTKEEVSDQFAKEFQRIKEEIQEVNKQIKDIEKNKSYYIYDRNANINELKMTKVKAEIELKKVGDKVNLAQLMNKMTHDELNEKKLILDKLIDPKKYDNSSKEDGKENVSKRKNLSSKKENSRKMLKEKINKRESNTPISNREIKDNKENNKTKKLIEDKTKSPNGDLNTSEVNKSLKQNGRKRNKLLMNKSNSTGTIINKKEQYKIKSSKAKMIQNN